jgi:hypothetical protein
LDRNSGNLGFAEASSKSSLNDRTPFGGLAGESSTKEVLAALCSSSSSSLSSFGGTIRRRFSLFGEGETGSPLSRLRARDTALFGVGANGSLVLAEVDEMGGIGAGKGSRAIRKGLDVE